MKKIIKSSAVNMFLYGNKIICDCVDLIMILHFNTYPCKGISTSFSQNSRLLIIYIYFKDYILKYVHVLKTDDNTITLLLTHDFLLKIVKIKVIIRRTMETLNSIF